MLVVEDLSKVFRRGRWHRPVTVLRNVGFAVAPGEAFGLVGPSGSGKSTVARIIMRLAKPTGGRVFYKGVEYTAFSPRRFAPYRRKFQIIFQQPTLALDPRRTVYDAIAEPLYVHGLVHSHREAGERVSELLALTNLPEEVLPRYPYQISGGQAQRVVIARALGMEPELIVADEPTSMLDLSVQAQILSLLKRLQNERGMSILLISHDPAVVRVFCDRVAVLQDGAVTACGRPAQVLKADESRTKTIRRGFS
ncbi:MAG: dipeptide/oligopeptide/nickel ABC transporter ATP-binding protein [Bacillota bacterium]